jgi:hypothetical protein
MKKIIIALGLLWLVYAMPAYAHKPSDSYVILEQASPIQTLLRWDIALRDLEQVLGLDTNQDGNITWGELNAKKTSIQAYATSHLSIQQDTNSCQLQPTDLQTDTHSDGAYAVLGYVLNCPDPLASLNINYHLLFDRDPTHRGILLDKRDASTTTSALFSPDKTQIELVRKSPSENGISVFFNYLNEGIYHILIGIDHLLFIALLILPSVLFVQQGKWQEVTHYQTALKNLLKIITAFTLAHSITLSLAVLGIVQPPTWVVESAIALSIIILALNILYPILTFEHWKLAFGFGLLHGFGFAVVLMDLTMPKATLAQALLGFNVGVEIGQLLVVLLLFPLVYALRKQSFYRVQILYTCATLTLIISSLWFVERAFDLKLVSS